MYHDAHYLYTLRQVLEPTNHNKRADRTGTGTFSCFAPHDMTFPLDSGHVPLLTVKKMNINSIIHELLWYIRGDSNVKYLNDNNVKIWNPWADENGDLGPVYGMQWRRCPKYNVYHKEMDTVVYHDEYCKSYSAKVTEDRVDQLQNCIDLINNDPYSRRIIVNSWNVAQIDEMRLPPCHYSFQFYCYPETKEMDLLLNMRSNDLFLGAPFNIIQYSLLLLMVCEVTGYKARRYIHRMGDAHIYYDHEDQCREILNRKYFKSPKFRFTRKVDSIDDFKFEDFEFIDYEHHPAIKAPVAV